jgi:hypothetical protein
MADHQLRVRHGAPDHRAFRKEECSKQMAAHLAKRGHDVTVVTGRPLLRRANNRFDGVRIVYVRCPDLPRLHMPPSTCMVRWPLRSIIWMGPFGLSLVPKRYSRPTSVVADVQSRRRPGKIDDIPVSSVELHGKMYVEGPTAWKARRRQPFGRRRTSRGQLT